MGHLSLSRAGSSGDPYPNIPPADGHQWISFEDENNDRWLFDVTFLLSGFGCIYGCGCPSIDTEPDLTEALGCCLHGAHFTDAEDRADVATAVARLTEDDWQFKAWAERKKGPFKKTKSGDWVTRRVDGACIMLNRADFAGGAGCALHAAALRHGERPLDWKPDVCWQVPIRLDIHTDEYGHDTVFVRAWERRDWGDGGQEFDWWCIESPEAYGHAAPVYQSCRDELIEMVGTDIYDRLAAALDDMRQAQLAAPISTPVELGRF